MKYLFFSLLALCCAPSFAQNVSIPDANFKAALVAMADLNTNGDTEIQVTEANAYEAYMMNVSGKSIADLTGISAFKKLNGVDCSNNTLTSLDFTGCDSLRQVYANNNQLTNLTVSGNPKLTTLLAKQNQLAGISLAGNPNLSELFLDDNKLTTLNLSANTGLTQAWAERNLLTSITFPAGAQSFSTVCLNGNKFASIDLSNVTELQSLQISSNLLTALDLSSNPDLIQMWCTNNQLTSLDLTNKPMKFLDCENNQLTSLILTGTSAEWSVLKCNYNKLTSLNCTGITKFGQLWCNNNLLTALDLTSVTDLGFFSAEFNQLASISVGHIANLGWCNVRGNQLTRIDVSANAQLSSLWVEMNRLDSLDVTNNPALTQVQAFGNKLKTLDLSHNPLLFRVQVNANDSLHTLDLRNIPLANLTTMQAENCPRLKCITVDDPTYCYTNWTAYPLSTDAGMYYSAMGCTVGVEEELAPEALEGNTANVYPNPAADLLTISVSRPSTVTLRDLSGKVLQTLAVEGETTVNIGHLAPGMYLLQTEGSGVVSVVKH